MTKGSSPLKTAALAEAQGGKCAYCLAVFTPDESDLDEPGVWPTFDHVVPKSRQGRNGINNGLAVCGPCNAAKGNRPPTKAQLKLLEETAPKALAVYARMTEELAQRRMAESARHRKTARKQMRREQREEARDEHLWPRTYRPAANDYVEREAVALTGQTG